MIKKRILELDALRGLAALFVVVFHYTMTINIFKYGFNLGCMGVYMFFIISGFVILMSVEKSKTWMDFVKRRFVRLYPTYWACVTITTILIIINSQSIHFQSQDYEITNNLIVKYILNMTMFQYFLKVSNIDAPYWTLTIELVFYILMIALLITKASKKIEYIGFFILILSICFGFNILDSNVIIHRLIMSFPLIEYFPLFYAGILLYKMKFNKITFLRLSLFGLTFVIQCFLYNKCYHITFVTKWEYILSLLVIYLIFILFLFNKLSFIVTPITSWLGKISYSLYTIHHCFGNYFLFPMLLKHFNFWTSFTITMVIVLISAELINRFVEIPSMNYFKRKSKVASIVI